MQGGSLKTGLGVNITKEALGALPLAARSAVSVTCVVLSLPPKPPGQAPGLSRAGSAARTL